ncbi:MAG TPA: alanine racemase [Firmicutes bacterium]|nr:alanine racemase [Bacillota bacterium]
MQQRYVELTEPTLRPDYAGLDDIGSSLIELTVDLNVYRRNLTEIQKFVAPSKVIAVLKANAYGFGVAGLIPVLNEFSRISAGVANADEALYMRTLGYNGKIVLLGYTHPKNYYQIIHSGCELAAYRFDNIPLLAEVTAKLEHRLKLHVKVNTGMNRLGISVDKLAEFIRTIMQFPQLEVTGLFTHLANAGEPEHRSNIVQANRFEQAIRIAEEELGYRPLCHIANSGALINFPDLHLDCVRIGALQYGYRPPGDLPEDLDLDVEPCFRLTSEVIDVHRVPAGEGVGYGWAYVTERDTNIATVPFGYADGMVRVPESQLQVLIRGKRYPVVGKVAMDYLEVALGDDEAVAGDEVVLVGGQGDEYIPLEEVAEKAGALTYQLSSSWGHRIRRVYDGNDDSEE